MAQKQRMGRFAYTYRRQLVDQDLGRAAQHLTGRVLDVGGKKDKKRGYFRPPETERWLYLNISPEDSPDILARAEYLPLAEGAMDAVICTEVLEHLAGPKQALAEMGRVLRPGGKLILTAPFLYRIHGDPHDFQRLTDHGLRILLEEAGFEIMELKRQGYFFTVLCDMLKQVLGEIPSRLVRVGVGLFFFPLARLLISLERSQAVQRSALLTSFTTGFFVLAEKRI